MQQPNLVEKNEQEPVTLSVPQAKPAEPVVSTVNWAVVLESRKSMLEACKKYVSAGFYEKLETKLAEERAMAESLSSSAKNKQSRRDKYTLILDTKFFEQQLY